jgi:Alanine-zipper, major outer membrane lipoprotein
MSNDNNNPIEKGNEVLEAIRELKYIAQLIESAIAEIDLQKEQALQAIDNRLLGLGLIPTTELDDGGNPFQLGPPIDSPPLPLITANYGPGVDPVTGEPLEGPAEAPVPVDVVSLKNQVNSLQGSVNSAKDTANQAQATANNTQQTANQAMSTAMRALSKASQPCLCKPTNSAVAQSDAETPWYVRG